MPRIVSVVLHLLVFLGAAVFWECVAWFMHRYVMHGFGWYLHQDHHRTSGRRLQKNDSYALFFAFVSFMLIFNGLRTGVTLAAAAGFGVALYGVGYVLFHDILFHRRVPGLRITATHPYLARIVASHRVHHRTVTRDGAVSFGFLWARKQGPRPA